MCNVGIAAEKNVNTSVTNVTNRTQNFKYRFIIANTFMFDIVNGTTYTIYIY